ncbi:MAG: hypothetical protein WDO12_13095 [Pseudomonadota bacterium]
MAALEKKDTATAKTLAGEAARLLPREAQFQQLLGDHRSEREARPGTRWVTSRRRSS